MSDYRRRIEVDGLKCAAKAIMILPMIVVAIVIILSLME